MCLSSYKPFLLKIATQRIARPEEGSFDFALAKPVIGGNFAHGIKVEVSLDEDVPLFVAETAEESVDRLRQNSSVDVIFNVVGRREAVLVILPRKALRLAGLVGGMEFQAERYVSFTHSSASSWFSRML